MYGSLRHCAVRRSSAFPAQRQVGGNVLSSTFRRKCRASRVRFFFFAEKQNKTLGPNIIACVQQLWFVDVGSSLDKRYVYKHFSFRLPLFNKKSPICFSPDIIVYSIHLPQGFVCTKRCLPVYFEVFELLDPDF